MGIIDTVRNYFSPPKKEKIEYIKEKVLDVGGIAYPTKGGRVSLPDYDNLYSLLIGDSELLANEVPTRILEVMAHLAKYNADISNAVENVTSMGNTPYTINVEGGNENTVTELQELSKHWYTGGLSSLRSSLLLQIAVYGAISAEIVPNESLTGIKKIILLTPSTIEFAYKKDKGEYIPYQRPKSAPLVAASSVLQAGGLIELNPLTFRYIATKRMSESPYAIPPFIAALESVKIEKDMLDGFKHVIHKLGILGFLHAVVAAPKKLPSETDAAYQSRCYSYLSDLVVPELEKGLAKGVVAGFQGSHEFSVEGTNTNVQGAKELFNLITEIKMSGLKQDPRLLGRQFSTTETYGKVILRKFSSQLTTYQMAMDDFLSYAFNFEAMLSNRKLKSIKVESEKPMISDEKEDQETYKLKIENGLALYKQGIISQEQLASMLGYDKPFSDMPLQAPQDTQVADTILPNSLDISNVLEALNSEIGEYDYGTEDTCGCGCGKKSTSLSFDAGLGDKIDELFNGYSSDIKRGYANAVKKSVVRISNGLTKLPKTATEQEVADYILYNLLVRWTKEFTEKQKGFISKWVTDVYKTFRKDPTFLGTKFDPKNPPKTVFGVKDVRTVEYFKNSDNFYLGKFITDKDTIARLNKLIREEYISNNIPLGTQVGIDEFRKKLGTTLINEDWKIDRIIATTTNKMRNYAGVAYMQDAEVVTFEIRGVVDRLQCDWCKNIQGKQFDVKLANERVEFLTKAVPEQIPLLSPFINQVLKDPTKIAEMSGAELQKMGIDLPAFHAGCRDTIVAVL